MRLEAFDAASPFIARNRALFEADEVDFSFTFGLASRLVARPPRTTPFFASVYADSDAGERLILSAAWTPPYGISLNGQPGHSLAAVDLLIDHLREAGLAPSGCMGPTPISEAFAHRWRGEVGAPRLVMGYYCLRRVDRPRNPPLGGLRPAYEHEIPLLVDWAVRFQQDTFGEKPEPGEAERMIGGRFTTGDLFFWALPDDTPIAMVATSRETTSGMTVNLVYTPPEARGRGYASAGVAALSQHILDRGKSFCVLFTDMANPTTNNIYPKVGYRWVREYREFRFAPVNP
jgi:hypothetical protein